MAGTPYREGDWFAVPLGDDMFALGRIARHHQGIVFAYFFGPAFDHLPTLAETEGLTADRALTQMLVSHLDLRDGAWPVLGRLDDWDPADWPMVEFERRIDRAGGPAELYAVRWDERTLNDEVSARPIDPSEAGLRPRDALSGAGAAVARLRHAFGL